MNQDQHHGQQPLRQSASEAIGATRRHLLTHLAVWPAALGLSVFLGRDSADARKDKKDRKQRGGKKGNGGGGGRNEEQAFLKLINDYRRNSGAGSLARQNQLDAAAQHHSQDMARKNYFRHSSRKDIERHGYRNWKAIGENIAAGDETAKQVFASWRKSPSHDKNMRSKNFTEIGIGRAYSKSSKYGWYWTTTFGDR